MALRRRSGFQNADGSRIHCNCRQHSVDVYLVKEVQKIGENLRDESFGEIQNVHIVRCRRRGNTLFLLH